MTATRVIGGPEGATAVFEGDDIKERAIIGAARKTFLARGFDGASMDAIALEAGVSKRTVYNRFRSKEELFVAAIDETCRRILPVNLGDIETTLPPREFVRRLARTVLRGLLDPEAIALRRIATFEAMRKPELGRAYLEHGPDVMIAACTPILERMQARGIVMVDDPVRAMWQLGALVTEPLYAQVVLGGPPDNLEEAIEEQIDTGIEAFWRIYGAPNVDPGA